MENFAYIKFKYKCIIDFFPLISNILYHSNNAIAKCSANTRS